MLSRAKKVFHRATHIKYIFFFASIAEYAILKIKIHKGADRDAS